MPVAVGKNKVEQALWGR